MGLPGMGCFEDEDPEWDVRVPEDDMEEDAVPGEPLLPTPADEWIRTCRCEPWETCGICMPEEEAEVASEFAPDEAAVFGHDDVDDGLERREGVEGLRLGHGSRQPIENKAVLAIILVYAIGNHTDENIIGNQIPGIHSYLGPLPDIGSCRDS